MSRVFAAALLVAAATAPEASAQVPPTVTAIRIDAPADEAAALARYVEMKPGEPLDPLVVRHVVELMHATGSYQDVIVETVDAPGGIEVVFRPVPAPLLARIVVEGDTVVGEDEVRRRTRLRPREPLWPARLDEAARDVALGLVERGWLEARVTAAARPGRRGVEAVFTITAGPRVRVSRVSVTGAPGEAMAAPLRNRARPRPGDVFVRPRATAAVEALRTELQKQGYWRAAVRVDEAYDPSAGHMALVFVVDPGPALRLEVEGPPAARGLADRLRRVLREGEGKVDALEQGTDLLEEELRRRGHRAVRVTRREESRPGHVVIVYAVDAGPRGEVASVRMEGDVTEGLAALVSTRPGEPLEERLLAEDARTLVRALEDRGHATPKVDAELPEGGGALPVVFRIAAGPATRLELVEVRSPEPLPADSPPQELRLRAGGPYRVRDLARDRDTVLAAYRTAGHLDAEVTPEVTFSEDGASARVVLHVRPGPATRVDHVVIAGLDRTKEAVVRRELEIREGEPLAVQRILESQRRLGSLGLFQRVSVAEMDPESRDARSVIVRVDEGPRTSVSYGVGYGEREKLRGSVEVTRSNLFGMDRRLSVFARASLQPSFRILATYREPYLLGHKQELFVTAYREDEDRPAFSFTRQGITVQTARPLSSTWSLILRETFEEGRTFNTDEDCLQFSREFCPHTISGPSASLVYDSRDDPLDPTRGHFVVSDFQLSHRFLGGNSLAKGYLQGAAYHLLRVGTVVAVSGRLGLGATFGPDEPLALPTPDRFFAGGDYTLRGFGTDAVRPAGGNAVLLAGVELRQRVVRSLWAAAFAETGNVYPLASDLTLRDLRYTAGLGLRYKSLVGPLRIDWGYKLDPVGDENRHHVHFTVGHAF